MTSIRIRTTVACLLMATSLLASSTSTIAAPHLRLLFGLERFTRSSGDPNVFRRTFRVPRHVAGPYTLTILNGQPDGRGRVAVESAAIGTVVLNGAVVAGPSDFSAKVGQITRTVPLSSTNVLEVTLAGAPGGFITVGITGVINVGDLTRPRSGHTASVLDDGSVLMSGGDDASGADSSAERFDAAALTFAASGNLEVARGQQSASVLPDGRHLLAAGRDAGGALNGAELFDPESVQFSTAEGGLQISRFGHTATVLIDGRVLIVGGRSVTTEGSAERFDAQPAVLFKPPYDAGAGTYTMLPQALQQARWDHTATLLRDGRVLILGGRNDSTYFASAEIFEPTTNQFLAITGMPEARAGHTATLLPDGRVLVLGGQNGSGYLNGGVVFDAATNTFTVARDNLNVARSNHTATLLPYGEILVAGGEAGAGPLAHTELYPPVATDQTRPTVSAALPAHTATGVDLTQVIGVRFSEPVNVTTLHSGSVVLTGGGPVDASINASENGLLLFVLPKQTLLAGTRYLLTLTEHITDTSGNPLEAVNFEFTTVAAPTIAAVTPGEGPVGTAVTILGQNFDTDPQLNVLTFGTTPALVLSATATQLEATVPTGLAAGNVALSVTTRGGTATSAFVVENPVPVVSSITPQAVRVGSGNFVLSVFGSGFTAASSVSVGGAVLTPLLQTATRLDVPIPAILIATLGTRNVVVQNPPPGGGPSNTVLLTVEGVVISGVTPGSGPVGTLVRISGAGFAPVLGDNAVRFNGTPAVVTSASATVLETIVPTGATSGPITVATAAGEATSSPFTVTTGTRLLISKTPDQSTYSTGQSITIHTLLVDANGQVVPGAVAELVSVPAATSRVGSTFVYQTSGTYAITATVTVFGQPITAATAITIAADRSIVCAAPFDGAFVHQAPGAVTFTGSVSTALGVGTVTVNGAQVAVGANGAFSTVINAVRGINFVDLVMTDAAGSTARRTCAFMIGDVWAAEGQFLPDTVSFRAAQVAIDDGNRAGPINSVGDILALATSGTNLRDRLHATLQPMNPLKPLSCDARGPFNICFMTSRIRYVNSHTPGPNTASLQLTNGGLVARMRWEHPSVALRVDGHVAGISYDTTGLVSFAYVEEELVFDLGVDSAGRPTISRRPGGFVDLGPMNTSFNGLDGFILNLLGTLSQGPITYAMTTVADDFGEETVASVMAATVGGLDVTTLAPVFDVQRLDGGTSIGVRADTRVSSFATNEIRALAGLGLRFQTAAAHARPSLGVSVPSGTVILDPLSSGQPAADAIHGSLLGQSLHALWRAGFFDAVLTQGGLNGVVPAGATLRVTTALPPAVGFRADGRVQIVIGAMNMHVDHPALLGDAVDSSLGARLSCDRRLNGDALVLENCTVDELHLSPDRALAESTAAALRELVSDVVRSIASNAAQQALPALPLPGFRIGDALAVYGLTPGAVLGITNPTVETAGNHLVVRGGFAIR